MSKHRATNYPVEGANNPPIIRKQQGIKERPVAMLLKNNNDSSKNCIARRHLPNAVTTYNNGCLISLNDNRIRTVRMTTKTKTKKMTNMESNGKYEYQPMTQVRTRLLTINASTPPSPYRQQHHRQPLQTKTASL